MAKKIKKILIVGDSNCLPRYNTDKKSVIKLEDTYLYKLKKKLKNIHFEQVTLGGITTSELINHAIPYYVNWEPDVLLMHTGINDTKTQIASGLKLKILYNFFKIFNISKKKFKSDILYNPSLLKYSAVSKTDLNSFEQNINKLKILFQDTKIYWLEIYSDENINNERPDTKKNIQKYNHILKKKFNKNFVKLEKLTQKKYFTQDGYHLNKLGHLNLCNKIIKILR